MNINMLTEFPTIALPVNMVTRWDGGTNASERDGMGCPRQSHLTLVGLWDGRGWWGCLEGMV